MCSKEVRIPAQDSYLIKERKSFFGKKIVASVAFDAM